MNLATEVLEDIATVNTFAWARSSRSLANLEAVVKLPHLVLLLFIVGGCGHCAFNEDGTDHIEHTNSNHKYGYVDRHKIACTKP